MEPELFGHRQLLLAFVVKITEVTSSHACGDNIPAPGFTPSLNHITMDTQTFKMATRMAHRLLLNGSRG